jgi:hypothetical protein
MSHLARCAAAALLLAALGSSGLQAATLEGRWRLVEERAGTGRANLAAPVAPLRLEFYPSGAALAGRIWTAEKPSRAFPWPSFRTEQGSLPIQLDERTVSPAGDRARALYRVKAPDGGDAELQVEEEYRLTEGGDVLLGELRIAVREQGESRGSYTLRRRFEREP